MKNNSYSVIQTMLQRGQQWKESLTDAEVDGARGRLDRHRDQGEDFRGTLEVTEILRKQFHDDRLMQRLVLEAAGRFGTFDEIIRDVRLKRSENPPVFDFDPLIAARDQYNATLGARLGLDEVTKDRDSGEVLARRAADWVIGLPDYQVEEVAQRAGDAVFPYHVVGLLESAFDRPDLLPHLTKQSVEDMRPFGAFLAEARQWGQLEHLDSVMAGRVRRCYHALMAAGLGVDMNAEVERRTEIRSEHASVATLIEVLTPHYSEPERVGILTVQSLELGRSFSEYLGALRAEGDLEHLKTGTVGRLRREYRALTLNAQQATQPETDVRNRAEEAEADDRPVYGKWSQQAVTRPDTDPVGQGAGR